jgi:hypothetical protein
MTSRSVIWVFIHACIHCTIVGVFCRHEISVVLASPSCWTHVTSWYHNLRSTFGHMTHGTWNIVLIQVARKYAFRSCFIFSTINSGTICLNTGFILVINWHTRQTQIIRSTTFITKPGTPDVAYRKRKRPIYFCDQWRAGRGEGGD